MSISSLHSALARRSRRTRFSSATLVGMSSSAGGSLLGARLAGLLALAKGLTGPPSFSLPPFLRGRPLLVPEGFGPPFACTGVLGLDKDEADLPVGAFAAVALVFLLVCAMEYKDGCEGGRQVHVLYVFFFSNGHADC
jgi:hypothetical protein